MHTSNHSICCMLIIYKLTYILDGHFYYGHFYYYLYLIIVTIVPNLLLLYSLELRFLSHALFVGIHTKIISSSFQKLRLFLYSVATSENIFNIASI